MSPLASAPASGGLGRIYAARAADALALAAAPTFLFMALITRAERAGPLAELCSAGSLPLLSGMTPMYLLMSVFHAGAWIQRLAGRR